MSTLTSTKRVILAAALAVMLGFAGALLMPAPQAEAYLAAGDLGKATPLTSFTPTMYETYSASAGKVVAVARTDSDAYLYEFQIARNKSFTSGVKTIKSKSTKVTFKGLKAGKKYYVRFHSYGDAVDGYSSIDWVSNWSKTSSVKVCGKPKAMKSKMTGKWKLVSSNWRTSLVKNNNKKGGKFTLTLKKSGKGFMKDYSGTKYSIPSWGATAKKAGTLSFSATPASVMGDYGTAKVKGKYLSMKTFGGVTMKFKKM